VSLVATFNIHHGAPASGPGRIDDVAAACAALDADLLALQEVDSRKQRSRFARQDLRIARVTGHHVIAAPAMRRGWSTYGTSLLSREPAGVVQFLRLPSLGLEPRVAILARVRLAGRAISVAAVHLQATAGVAEVQLEAVLDALLRRPGPHLLLGDLNMDERRGASLFTRRRFRWAAPGPTFPAVEPRTQIDWIAARGIELGDGSVPDVRVSDHRPLVAHLG
jgi:endonuclease/exonuclease/phosphatase family metal-dependent hydrolase